METSLTHLSNETRERWFRKKRIIPNTLNYQHSKGSTLRVFNSVGLECHPYKVEVVSSSLTRPTNNYEMYLE